MARTSYLFHSVSTFDLFDAIAVSKFNLADAIAVGKFDLTDAIVVSKFNLADAVTSSALGIFGIFDISVYMSLLTIHKPEIPGPP